MNKKRSTYNYWKLNSKILGKRRAVWRDLGGPISSGNLAHWSCFFFTSICIVFSVSYIYAILDVTLTSLARLFINPEFRQCPLRRLCKLQLFWFLKRLYASAASAYNWANYHTFNVMVLQCTHCITSIKLNVSQTGCVVAFPAGIWTGLTSSASRLSTPLA